jgi:glucoamylase
MADIPRRGDAPGGPSDAGPTWTSSAKDLVTTGLGSSQVWATLGHGILNEVYWPSTGQPQIRDLGFIVAGPHGWREVKRVNRYALTTPQPDIPLPTVVHEGDGYRLTLEIVPDPARDVLLVRYALDGDGLRLYPLLAPRLWPRTEANTAMTGAEALWADGGACWLCLACSAGFSRASAGRVGTSDGWQDFNLNGRMTWEWDRAGPGNVALMGEAAENAGVLALGFSTSCEGATTLARSSIASGFADVRAAALAAWQDWAADVDLTALDALDPPLVAQARRSAAVLKVHEDRTFPGAIVASLSVPWGNSRNDLGGYHLVWARDAVNAGLGLLAVGLVEDARRMLAYLIAMQQPDGHWAQNFYPGGRAYWKAVQLDEVGYPVLLAARMREAGLLDADGETAPAVRSMVARAAGYIVRNGPLTAQDRWEENAGLSPFSVAVAIAALVAAAAWLDGDERACVLDVADDWNARIEDWSYAAGTALARAHRVDGHYVRIVPDLRRPVAGQSVVVHNRGGLTMPADALVSLEFLALSRFGLRSARDPRMQDTAKVCDAVLGVATPQGTSLHRYNEDGYGEHADGSPFDGTGIGRGWPLLSGERGHFALQGGEDARPWLEAMARMTGPNGMIPEQVWDAAAIPAAFLEPGRPSGSAMPLVWAHSEYLKLALAICSRRPLELLAAVETRYGFAPPRPSVLRWRTDTPVAALSRARALLVEDTRPFVLHFSLDEWRTAADRQAGALPFGMYGVRLEFGADARALVFTRRFGDDWEGADHRVALTD